MLKFILNLLFPKQNKEQIALPVVISNQLLEYITLDDWITSSGSYPERAKSLELTDSVKNNAIDLIRRINSLLNELQWNEKVRISSGFRPSEVNANVPNSAKKSAHMIGMALDIYQPLNNNKLGLLIRKIQDNQGKFGILGKKELMMEKLESTVGKNSSWVHLDIVKRNERQSMEFIP